MTPSTYFATFKIRDDHYTVQIQSIAHIAGHGFWIEETDDNTTPKWNKRTGWHDYYKTSVLGGVIFIPYHQILFITKVPGEGL